MKIAFLNGDLPDQNDGYHQLTRKIITTLSEHFDVHLICYKGGQTSSYKTPDKLSSFEVMENTNDSLKRVSQAFSLFSKESMIRWQFKSLNLGKLNQRLNEINPDIIILNHIRAAWAVPHLNPKFKASKIYLAHNCESIAYRSIADLQTSRIKENISLLESRKVLELEKNILDEIDTCIALTSEDAERMNKISPIPEYVVIPPGVNLPEKTPEESKAKGLLLVGSYKWDPKKKNALWLANEVLPLINKKYPKVTLKIVGSGANELKNMILHKDLVEIHSDVPSTFPYFNKNNIFIIPERQKGGIKLKSLEAASFGIPIVSTPEGIEGSGLRDHESCLLASTKEEFADRVSELLADSEKMEEMGNLAKDHVLQNFQWEMINEKYIDLMNQSVKISV